MADLDWRNDSEADDRLNPAELQHQEQNADTGGDTPSTVGATDTDNIDAARSAESSGGWANNVSGKGASHGAQGGAKNKLVGGLKKFLGHKATPMGLLGGSMIGLVGFGGFFAVPGALVAHITEIVTQRWNFQQVQMKRSDDHILRAKLSDGAKCGKLTIRCKFGTFSKKELEALEKQGITVEGGKEPLLQKGGRKKATRLTIKYGEFDAGSGKMIEKTESFSARQALRELQKPNSRLRVAATTAYNTNQHGWGDKRFFKIARDKFKIDKRKPLTAEDKKNKKSMMQKLKKVAENGGKKGPPNSGEVPCKDEQGKDRQCTDEGKEKNKKPNEAASEMTKGAEDVAKEGQKMDFTKGGTSVSSKIGAIGWLQGACDVASLMNIIENGAKAIRGIQLAGVGFLIVKTGHLLKSGDADPSDIRAVAEVLTEIVTKPDGTKSKSAMDSFGYRNAAFKDTDFSDTAMKYGVAGAYTGVVLTMKENIYNTLGGRKDVKKKCKIINSGPAKALSTGAGVAALFVPGLNVAAGLKMTAQIAAGFTTDYLVQTYLIPMAINTLSGVVLDDETFGEDLGDAFVTGYQVLAGEIAGGSGGAPLTPDQAVNNAVEMDVVSKENAIYERETRSPWDINSPYTMVGSLFGQFVPYMSQFSTAQGTLSAIGSITASSLQKLINPAASAAQRVETLADYTSDDDTYYVEDVASTRQGAVVYGLPSKVLDITPEQAYTYLMGHVTEGIPDPHIDLETGEPRTDKFKKFVEMCMRPRENPIGTDELAENWKDGKETNGLECMVKDEDYTLGYNVGDIEKAVGELKKQYEAGSVKLDEDIPSDKSSDYGKMTAEERIYFLAWNNHLRNIQNREEGFQPVGGQGAGQSGGATSNWTLEDLAQPYTGPCAPGTEDIGIKPTMFKGKDIPSRVCALPGFTSTSGESQGQYNSGYSGGMILVNARVSEAWLKLLTDAKAAGALYEAPTATSSWRTPEHQRAILGGRDEGRPGVASVGFSNHQAAYAIDFNMGPGNDNSYAYCANGPRPCTPPAPSKLYDWMTANGRNYGFSQISNEYWHFEPNALHGGGS